MRLVFMLDCPLASNSPGQLLARKSHSQCDGAICRMVVSAQQYAAFSRSGAGKERWYATAIDECMRSVPELRVSFVDKVCDYEPAGSCGVPHAVLLRWNAARDCKEEIYRVRLPWHNESGSGVILGVHCSFCTAAAECAACSLERVLTDCTTCKCSRRLKEPSVLLLCLLSTCP